MSRAVRVKSVSKRYGDVWALRDVSAEFLPGEIHAVVGENGAGKSTLMNGVAGFVRFDGGEVWAGSALLPMGDPDASAQAGLAMVHQHFMLVPEFSVEENLALGALLHAPFLMQSKELAAKAVEIGRTLGWSFDLGEKTSSLGVGQQQRLEILKVLATGAETLILDEPTAVLRADEVQELFRVLRNLRAEGRTLVLVAHKLAEVLEIADRVTVLRQGRFVATAPRAEVDAELLTRWIVGEALEPAVPSPREKRELAIRVAELEVLGDRGELRVDRATFEVCSGEILGIGGVDGNGQVELAEALVGIRPARRGQIERTGTIGYVPQDRHRDGLALGMSVQENLLIQGHRKPSLYRGWWFDRRKIADWAVGIRDQYAIASPSVELLVGQLSGGNQQKVVVGRTLDSHPDVLVLVNPTRGLDLRATAFVRSQVKGAAANGAAVVLVSTDADELAELSDRQLFLSGGKLAEPSSAAFLGGAA